MKDSKIQETVSVTNHNRSEVHIHPLSPEGGRSKTGMESLVKFFPGRNRIEISIWESIKDLPIVKAFIEDDILEEDGPVGKDEVPTLKEYVESGYDPAEYRERFPVNAKKVDDLDIAEAQKAFDEEKAKSRRDRRAGR